MKSLLFLLALRSRKWTFPLPAGAFHQAFLPQKTSSLNALPNVYITLRILYLQQNDEYQVPTRRRTGVDRERLHHQSHLFTVRLWQEEVGNDQAEWRGKV